MSHLTAAASPDPDSGENAARSAQPPAGLFRWDDLERLRAAANAILGLADDDAIPAPLESELTSFKQRLEHVFRHLRPDR